jgi:hypothetical protein
MAKFQSPLLGYNNNVRHKNRVFHIQTEDSGVNHPHIITHLFMDGGRILKSVKKSYAEHVGVEGMSEVVRAMMKEQHKAMFIALRDGQFDHLVEPSAPGVLVPSAPAASAPAAGAAPAGAAPAGAVAGGAVAGGAPAGGAPAGGAPAGGAPAAAKAAGAARVESAELAAPPTIDESRRSQRPAANDAPPASRTDPTMSAPVMSSKPGVAVPSAAADDAPMTTRQPSRERAAASSAGEPAAGAAGARPGTLTLDLDALERAAKEPAAVGATGASSLFQANDLPPPPKNLFAKEIGTGKYSAVEGEPPRAPARAASAPPASSAQPRSGSGSRPPTPPSKPSSEGRYAPSRPAAIFGSSANRPQPQSSIFGDELLSDKSLDEVILSYLAEDLEPPRRK